MKTQYVSGYFRYKEEGDTQKEEGNVIIALGLILMTFAMLLVIFWQFAVVAVVSTGVGITAKKYIEKQNDPERLIINHYR